MKDHICEYDDGLCIYDGTGFNDAPRFSFDDDGKHDCDVPWTRATYSGGHHGIGGWSGPSGGPVPGSVTIGLGMGAVMYPPGFHPPNLPPPPTATNTSTSAASTGPPLPPFPMTVPTAATPTVASGSYYSYRPMGIDYQGKDHSSSGGAR